ncbi:multifunctional CCA addition/repair protein [Spiribacter sp. 2438]|uniref:multifunctional CCA addition/repair protein n=1 Tax=Spiribacter sp. 2438 TaxID=2666185 RepID=UPI0012AF7910|nr:multifunctional CCA addition/repair protein [Spiribacter sp. 2438]QGM22469.1 multifunctional CCA addition/repair protein [Spiribacter sp. 2438]
MTPPAPTTYEVGGAVRDALLGLPVDERDWVVVGATPDDMVRQGFRPVGRDFPVFLHPETGEEYALARTERKVAPGYRGFEFHASPDITLEADLARRDLTINAMARDTDGRLVDPYGGQADLRARRLRHVSDAFGEDPVRILRLARFAARLAPLGFEVAEETRALCRTMVEAGEVDALVPERVWKETSRALIADAPGAFIRVLRDCGALAVLLPEVDQLFGVPQPARHHPEIDSGEHTLLALSQSVRLDGDLPVRFSVLVHDVGKGLTPAWMLPGHRGHEERGVPLVDALCERLRVPTECRDLARGVTRYHLQCHRVRELRPETLLRLLQGIDALRRPERLTAFIRACEADYRGRLGLEDRPYPQAAYLHEALERCLAVDARAFVDQGLRGPAIGEAMENARREALEALRASHR